MVKIAAQNAAVKTTEHAIQALASAFVPPDGRERCVPTAAYPVPLAKIVPDFVSASTRDPATTSLVIVSARPATWAKNVLTRVRPTGSATIAPKRVAASMTQRVTPKVESANACSDGPVTRVVNAFARPTCSVPVAIGHANAMRRIAKCAIRGRESVTASPGGRRTFATDRVPSLRTESGAQLRVIVAIMRSVHPWMVRVFARPDFGEKCATKPANMEPMGRGARTRVNA